MEVTSIRSAAKNLPPKEHKRHWQAELDTSHLIYKEEDCITKVQPIDAACIVTCDAGKQHTAAHVKLVTSSEAQCQQ